MAVSSAAMSSHPAAEDCSHDNVCAMLGRLKSLLDNLPSQLPPKTALESNFGDFLKFQPDPDILERTGCEVSALSVHPKHAFGWQSRTQGGDIVPFTERGAAVSALC